MVKKETKAKKPSSEETILELTQTLQRLQAEFENYKKRTERERSEQAKYATESLLKKILPMLDNFELALSHSTKKDDFTKGIELIYASVVELLEAEGVTPIPTTGLPFDPYRHEALLNKESKEPQNTVIDVMQKGYVLHDRVLRPAKVIISKGGMQNE